MKNMKTSETLKENLCTCCVITFIPLIVAGIISLICGIVTGDISTDLLS